MQRATTRAIIHVDMDAFYAAVEQRDHPAYRGRPVIVGADPRGGKGRGVVAACSYEARVFGVRSALPISMAYRRCSHAIFLPVRMNRYTEVSERVFAILRRYTDLVEPISIDEAFVDVSKSTSLFGEPAGIGRRIKTEILREEGLSASVGVASNKFVAKIASDLEKPDGFVVVRPEEVETFLANLSVAYLWGVGEKTAAALQRLGIRTIGQLARRPVDELYRRFGKMGIHLHQLSRGIDGRPVIPQAMAKSIGAETTFPVDTAEPEQIRQTLLGLAERVSTRLRREGYTGQTITLKLRYADFTTLTRSLTLPEPVMFTEEIHAAVLSLLQKVSWRGQSIRLLGIAVSKLADESAPDQVPLFPAERKREKMARAVDEIRRRFGEGGITRAILSPPGSRRKVR